MSMLAELQHHQRERGDLPRYENTDVRTWLHGGPQI